jgi:hypothetical protein
MRSGASTMTKPRPKRKTAARPVVPIPPPLPKPVLPREIAGPGSVRLTGWPYRVYVQHEWGTDRMTVTIKKRSVKLAGEMGYSRAIEAGHKGVNVLDVIPCRYVAGALVETRKMRVQQGQYKAKRRARARVSRRETRRTK